MASSVLFMCGASPCTWLERALLNFIIATLWEPPDFYSEASDSCWYPDSLPCCPLALERAVCSFPMMLQSLVAVNKAAPSLCEVPWRCGAAPQLFPIIRLCEMHPNNSTHLSIKVRGTCLCCTPLCLPCPVGKPQCIELRTDSFSNEKKKQPTFNRQLFSKTLHFSLALQDTLRDPFLLLPVTLFACISLRNTHCSPCGCFLLFLQSLLLHIPAYFYHSPSLP